MALHDTSRLPGLTPTATRWLVAEAQRVLLDLGHATTVLDGFALQVTDGSVMGLDNLARTVSRLPRKRWARAVRDQLTTLDAARAQVQPTPESLRVKLWTQEQADELLHYDGIELLPGLVAVLAAQGEGCSTSFGDLDLVGDRDTAFDAALHNMAHLPRPRHARRRVDPHVPCSWVEFLGSDDAHGAARVTVLPDLLRRLRIPFPPHGVLVSVPTKYQLWVHVPVDHQVLDTAVAMSWLAFQAVVREPYPVSPDVFLVSPDMHAVTVVTPDARGFDLDDRALHDLIERMGTGRAAG